MSRRKLTESERIEREEFARGHIRPGETPVEPRPAATLVTAREGSRGLEEGGRPRGEAGVGLRVLLLRRPSSARFAAGAWVFPGGVLDPEDDAPDLATRFGPGVTRARPDALVAALRESFEETGLLPADAPPTASQRREGRRALLEGRTDFPTLIRRWELRFDGLRTAYFARWVTPATLSRRYDAHFFLAAHRGGEPELIHGEHTASTWVEPARALALFEEGELPMLFPTRKTMETLASFRGLEEALERLGEERVRPIRPRLRVEGEAVIPLMPGEPGYDEAGRGADGEAEGRAGGR